MRLKTKNFFLQIVSILSILYSQLLCAEDYTEKIKKVITEVYGVNDKIAVALVVQDPKSQKFLANLNGSSLLKPASVMKVLTSGTALKNLGPEYKFLTKFFWDGRTLRVVGGGDPLVVTETAWMIARALKSRGIDSIENLDLDPSFFESEKGRVGRRAYEAGSSALSMNFNSQAFIFCPAESEGKAYVTLEPPNNLIDVVSTVKTINGNNDSITLEPADWSEHYTAKGTIGKNAGCSTIYRSVPEPAKFFGEVFTKCLQESGIKVNKKYKFVWGGSGGNLIYQNESRPFRQILVELNQYSNNFIAEQFLYALGCIDGRSCSRERGIKKINEYAASVGISKDEINVVDGSGLDHDNKLSASAIVKVLTDIFDNNSINAEFFGSLSVGGRNGTLRSRFIAPPDTVLRAKTGTLTGVHALAGTINDKQGNPLIFALIQNGVPSPDKAHGLEKKILNIIHTS